MLKILAFILLSCVHAKAVENEELEGRTYPGTHGLLFVCSGDVETCAKNARTEFAAAACPLTDHPIACGQPGSNKALNVCIAESLACDAPEETEPVPNPYPASAIKSKKVMCSRAGQVLAKVRLPDDFGQPDKKSLLHICKVDEGAACNIKNLDKLDTFSLVTGKGSDAGRIYFYRNPADKSPGSAYVVAGDVVQHTPEAVLTEFGKKPLPEKFCAAFITNNSKPTLGWISKEDLESLPTDPSQLSSKANLILKSASPKEWPSKIKGPFNYSIKLLATKPAKLLLTGGFAPDAQEEFLVENRIARSSNTDGCSVTIYRANNVLVFRTDSKGIMCWGNHGQSNPEGIYLPQ